MIREARALRQLMRREYRVLLPDKHTGAQRLHVAETEIRTPERAVELRRGGPAPAETTPVGTVSIGTPDEPLERSVSRLVNTRSGAVNQRLKAGTMFSELIITSEAA